MQTTHDFEKFLTSTGEVGYVEQIRSSLIYANGLPGAKPQELVLFEQGGYGQVMGVGQNEAEILTFFKKGVPVGSRLARTNQFLSVPASFDFLGRVIDPLCLPQDGKELPIKSPEMRSLEVTPLGIISRRKITRQLETGISLVDIMTPLGCGQRELVVGDRKTGKTSFIQQTILNQAKLGTICLYVAIGKKIADVLKIKEFFETNGVLKNIVIIATGSDQATGLVYLTPYTAMSLAEFFRDKGRDTLIVFDDLTTHAKYYREISLLARRFPGRESYPGDMFYAHSKLLERAGNFIVGDREVAITALPVAESIEGDLSGYIQTNIMSMVDGHLFFDLDLFLKGRRPAINPLLSVTRVGRQTQPSPAKDINREIGVVLSLYERSLEVAHFGSALLESMKLSLQTGERIISFFDQESEELMPISAQIILFTLLWINFWGDAQAAVMKNDMHTLTLMYQTDTKVRSTVDELVSNSQSFNVLLGKVNDKRSYFDKLLQKK